MPHGQKVPPNTFKRPREISSWALLRANLEFEASIYNEFMNFVESVKGVLGAAFGLIAIVSYLRAIYLMVAFFLASLLLSLYPSKVHIQA